MFDPIAYEKTSGVLNMIEAYVGPEAFRKGVSAYLTRYSSGNAAGEDFWTEMTRVTEKPVNRIMRSFVDQAGAPSLSVRTRCVNGSTQVTVRQRRFEGAPAAGGSSKAAAWQPWSLPVCVTTGGGQPSCQLVSAATETFTAAGCGAAFVNADARGYYFTEYEPEAITALATQDPATDHGGTHQPARRRVADRASPDATTSAPISTWRPRSPATRRPTSPPRSPRASPTSTGRSPIPRSATPSPPGCGRRSGRRSTPSAKRRRPGDSDDVLTRRGELWELLGLTAGDTALQARARTLAEGYLADPSSLPPSFVVPVLQVAAAGGDAALYDRYVAAAKASLNAPEQYYRLFNALASFRSPELAERTLAFALSPEVRSQDAPLLLGQLLNSSAQDKTWAALSSQWDTVVGRLGDFQSVPYVVIVAGRVLQRREGRRNPRVLRRPPGARRGPGAPAGAGTHRRLRGPRPAPIRAVRHLARRAAEELGARDWGCGWG